jgi:glutathione S-transferase
MLDNLTNLNNNAEISKELVRTQHLIHLYQFPISHYCEKIRWALKFKNIDHNVINMIPGLHINQMKKLGLPSSVPAIVDGDNIIQGSIEIIDYLDDCYPSPQKSNAQLTPTDEKLKAEVLKWEHYIDLEIGIHVRRCVYHILLEYPKIVKPFFTHNGPWYGGLFLFFAYSKIKSKMRYFMKINDETYLQSKQAMSSAIDKLHEHYQKHEFLVGDSFTRADLSAAALLAPLTMQKQYGLNWPDSIPLELEELMNEFSEKLLWVDRLYSKYR